MGRAACKRRKGARHAAWAAAVGAVGGGCTLPLGFGSQSGFFIKFGSFALYKAQRAFGAVKAGPKAVTIYIADKLGLAVNDGKRALGTVKHTFSTAVALFFVDLNDGTFHSMPPLRDASAPLAFR